MAFPLDDWVMMTALYGEEEGPRQFQIRQDAEKPFNLHTIRGRFLALKFLYQNLPFELFRFIFKLVIGMSTEVVHPISGELVSRSQMKLSRVVFWRMFVYEPEFDQVMLWNKRFPEEIREHFCRYCGSPRLSLVWNNGPTPCLTKKGAKCRHPIGNYLCHRSISLMGGVCYVCVREHNVPFTGFL